MIKLKYNGHANISLTKDNTFSSNKSLNLPILWPFYFIELLYYKER